MKLVKWKNTYYQIKKFEIFRACEESQARGLLGGLGKRNRPPRL
jgi:hypothetical protein